MSFNRIKLTVCLLMVLCFTSAVTLSHAGVVTGNADLVLGQVCFSSNTDNQDGGPEADTLSWPAAIDFDAVTGRMYVADDNNNRILWWNNPDSLVNGQDADGVLGQVNLSTDSANRGGSIAANTLNDPAGVIADASGNVWVADGNNRILRYSAPVTNGMNADLVIGATDFSYAPPSAVTRNGFSYLWGQMSFDAEGNLWVPDYNNNRVLRFDAPFSNGMDADLVLGATDYNYKVPNSAAADTFYQPYMCHVDADGALWVCDYANSRLLGFTGTFQNGMDASIVLGQVEFSSNTANMGGDPAANTLNEPGGFRTDSQGNLWVTDYDNNRALRYPAPLSSGMNADVVLGQAFFDADLSNRTTKSTDVAANTLYWPWDLDIDSRGNVWILDSSNNRILKFNTLRADSVTPQSALNTAAVSITNLAGQEFAAGMQVQLTRTGETAITAGSVSVVCSSHVTCTFDITGKAGGYWDITITSGVFTYTMERAFMVYALSEEEQVLTSSDTVVTLNAESGDIEVEVPAGSFATTVTLAVSTTAVPSSDRNTVLVSPLGVEVTASGSAQPQNNITITINYRDADITGLDESKLVIARYDSTNSRWVVLPSTVYTAINKVVATTNHLSKFAVVQVAAAADYSAISAYPNPFNPGTDTQGLIFENMVANSAIKIYTIAGELVRTIQETDGNGREAWDGTNTAGRTVASGVYIVYFNSASGTKKIKIAVEK